MDGDHQHPPEMLEDQVRRMIISSRSAQSAQDGPGEHGRPIVRLPPPGLHQTQPQAQYQGPPNLSQDGPHRNPGFHAAPHPSTINGQGNSHGMRQHQAGSHGFHQNQNNFNRRPPPHGHSSPHQRSRYQQQLPLDPNAFQRGGYYRPQLRQHPGQQPPQLYNPNAGSRQLYQSHHPRGPPAFSPSDQHMRQTHFLETLAAQEIRAVDMDPAEREEKESFRLELEQICHEVCAAHPHRLPQVSLECFGSFQSGFATAGSDMDLAIVVKDSSSTSPCCSLHENDLPRVLERQLLYLGYGARLLTRTRVPIIKVCQKPDVGLLSRLREKREKWDALEDDKKYPHLHQGEDEGEGNGVQEERAVNNAERETPDESVNGGKLEEDSQTAEVPLTVGELRISGSHVNGESASMDAMPSNNTIQLGKDDAANEVKPRPRLDDSKTWTRERKAGPLDFPKSGVGIQSDINFFNPLGLHNTQLLRCYSLCDPRVRPMVLFIKSWVKRRKINSSYFGTLSSYGYVLMVLHYLVNIAQPPVLPNLQSVRKASGRGSEMIDGWDVSFWRDEAEITAAAQRGDLTANREALGSLLAGFFNYYSSQGGGVQFFWMQEVLSLRSPGGLLTKEQKGWVKAVTEEDQGKRIQHRYLFCIEDPFELGHNVARTVTHRGIVAIRDEFRRARRILVRLGLGQAPEGGLFDVLVEPGDDLPAAEQVKANGILNGEHTVPGTGANDVARTHGGQDGNKQQAYGPRHQLHTTDLPTHSQASDNQPFRRARQAQAQPTNASPRPPPKSGTPVNIHDAEAFPSLHGTQPTRKGAPQHSSVARTDHKPRAKRGKKPKQLSAEKPSLDFGEAGKRGTLTEETQAEHLAESTAMDVAEAVLR